MKKIVLTTIVSLLSVIGYSQNGKVTDSNGELLVGAKVEVPSENIITYTNLDGYYDIDVPEGTEIVVSYISYESKTIQSRNNMTVTLDDINIDKLIKK
jgi:hypothetical protein